MTNAQQFEKAHKNKTAINSCRARYTHLVLLLVGHPDQMSEVLQAGAVLDEHQVHTAVPEVCERGEAKGGQLTPARGGHHVDGGELSAELVPAVVHWEC